MKHYTAWELNTKSLKARLADDLKSGAVESNDVVWRGPSGDAVVAATPADLEDTDYAEYTDHGTVSEYIDEK